MNKQFDILNIIKNDNNSDTNYVSLKEILLSNDYKKVSTPFSIPLGKDENRNLVIINLENIENLLICGSSGRGKTSTIFTILFTLILQNNPEELKLICLDSMKVEYLPFLNTEYSLIKYEDLSQKDLFEQTIDYIIQETNNRLKSDTSKPKIVCTIDNFADFQIDCQLKKSNKFNDFINNIPLMNSVGIYVILSTSRPTKDVITDKLKEIISNRVVFALFNSDYSHIIINEGGADILNSSTLGDCLLKTKESIKHLRSSYIDYQDMVNILKQYNKNKSS